MIQREQRHPAASFPPCRECGREPRHVIAVGSHSGESFDVRRPTGTRHTLECRCGARTVWMPTLAAAQRAWHEHFAAVVPDATRRPASTVRPLLRMHHNKEHS